MHVSIALLQVYKSASSLEDKQFCKCYSVGWAQRKLSGKINKIKVDQADQNVYLGNNLLNIKDGKNKLGSPIPSKNLKEMLRKTTEGSTEFHGLVNSILYLSKKSPEL